MRGKEFWKSVVLFYFTIVTLINLAIYVLGTYFLPDIKFGYDAFLAPLFYGVLCIIPYCVMYSQKELTIKQCIVREILQLISIEAIMFFVVFGIGGNERHNYGLIAAFIGSVFVIYVLTFAISTLLDYQSAKRMTESLHCYQSRIERVETE